MNNNQIGNKIVNFKIQGFQNLSHSKILFEQRMISLGNQNKELELNKVVNKNASFFDENHLKQDQREEDEVMKIEENTQVIRNFQDINNRKNNRQVQTELKDRIYSLFLIKIMDLHIFDQVLSFLDIDKLNQFANMSNQIRIRVKKYFLCNTFQKQIKCFEKQKKTALYETMLFHMKNKMKFYYQSEKFQEKELLQLNVQDHLLQLTILFNDLIDQGAQIKDISEVIPYVKQRGVRESFSDVFNLEECSYSSQVNQKNTLVELTQSKNLSQKLNLFLSILQEQRAIRTVFKFDEDEIGEREMKSQIIRYINWKGFERVRPIVVKRIQGEKFRKENNIYAFLNKNNLNRILPFLSVKEIIRFAQTSKKINWIISLNIENQLHQLIQKKQEKIQELNIDESLIQQAEQFSSYLILNNRIQECLQFEVVLISNLQAIVQILNYLTDQNQSMIDLGQAYAWEYILEQREAVYSQFIQQFIPQTNTNGQVNSTSQTQDQSQIQEEPVSFYYESQEEFSIITQTLKSIRNQLRDNLEIDPSFQTYLHEYFTFFYQINKQIILLTKLYNKNTIIPPIYANSIFDNLILSFCYEYTQNQQEEQNEGANDYQNQVQEEEQQEQDEEEQEQDYEEQEDNQSQIEEEDDDDQSQQVNQDQQLVEEEGDQQQEDEEGNQQLEEEKNQQLEEEIQQELDQKLDVEKQDETFQGFMRNQSQQNSQSANQQHILKPVGKYWLIFGIILAIDLVAIVLPLVSHFKIAAINSKNDHIMSLYDKPQIKDIIVIKESENQHDDCPQDYHDIFNYEFQGYKPFYLCRQNVLPYKQGETYVDEREQCQFFEDQKPKKLSILKLGNENIRICGKYMNINIQQKQQCDQNEVVCSFISEFNSFICANSEKDCPINNIQMDEIQSANGSYQQQLSPQRQAPNQLPLLGFEIVEGETKCINKDASMFQDRKYHEIFKRMKYSNQCDRDYLYNTVFDMSEHDFYEANDMNFLNQINDFNPTNQYKYTSMIIHQVPWDLKHRDQYESYIQWWNEDIIYQDNIQVFFLFLNLITAILVALLSWISTDRIENFKLGFKLFQIIALWFFFIKSILKYRYLFQDITSNAKISSPQIISDVLKTKQIYYESIDLLDTIMISFVTTSIMLCIMQKWYFRKQTILNSKVSIQQLQTFQPFFDDDQI
ncbi:transmembrane protein, putative (macronuclear) [Tetrahymena thermophila SB210]|uniref:Transmembrane protein, putative n=1 Tax=Tetrahymena thermophila (strain SB210) TaxID=312017 RepID=I7M1X4_TETTS|nr:transmembrane protein, putative [Tetrahymena thermophila SB210]EAR97965.2 transmembrane protein, putative [Tetrahymena thermophila SB210]|eukprot:XP_001018210.2 transmembrane protein, putative [Tetrahymena thermophila SB210]